MRRHPKRPMSEINVVPYIDVMLVLLVIFMVTAPLLAQGVKIDLPQAAAEALDQEQREPLVVSVDAEGRFFVDVGDTDEPVDARTLVNRVSAVLRQEPQTQVLVRGDEKVGYGQVVRAMTLVQEAGASHVGLVTRPPAE